MASGYDYSKCGDRVVDIRTGKIGVVLGINTETYQVQVLESIEPYVLNTHDSSKYLLPFTENSLEKAVTDEVKRIMKEERASNE